MTYEEFKNTFSLNDLKNIKNPNKELKTYIDETNHKLYDLLFIFSFNLFTINFSDYLTKEDMNKKISILLKEQQEKHDELIANRILSYEDFKKITMYEWLNSFNIDLYTDDELFNVSQWAKQAEEELYQSRMHDRIITEGIEPEDSLTEEEENTPIQQLIDEAKSKWIK